jgi:hypothetical protein
MSDSKVERNDDTNERKIKATKARCAVFIITFNRMTNQSCILEICALILRLFEDQCEHSGLSLGFEPKVLVLKVKL